MYKKQILIISIIFILSTMTCCDAAENTVLDNLVLYNLNASEINSVPTGFYLGTRYTDSDISVNATLTYNNTLECIRFRTQPTDNGKTSMWISNLYPSTDSTTTITVGIDSTTANTNTNFQMSNWWTRVQKLATGQYRLTSFYYSGTPSTLKSAYITIPAASIVDNKITFSVTSDEYNHTNTLRYNDTLYLTTPLYSVPRVPETYVAQSIMQVYNELSTGKYANANIYSIRQEIPRHIITSRGTKSYIAFGLDKGMHPVDKSLKNGTTYMNSLGHRGTIWADVDYMDAQTIAYINTLLDDGWELGIHYSEHLTGRSLESAEALMDSEYATISTTFNRSPTTFCSLENADNSTHGEYAYNTYGMIRRNGNSGTTYIPAVGNIDNRLWDEWWKPTIDNAGIYPSFSHMIDYESDIDFSLTKSHFRYYVNNYTQNNVTIVGFEEYIKRNRNQNDSTISFINDTDFMVGTTGFPATLNIFTGHSDNNISVYDVTDGVYVNSSKTSDAIEFDGVNAHRYRFVGNTEQISNDSASHVLVMSRLALFAHGNEELNYDIRGYDGKPAMSTNNPNATISRNQTSFTINTGYIPAATEYEYTITTLNHNGHGLWLGIPLTWTGSRWNSSYALDNWNDYIGDQIEVTVS